MSGKYILQAKQGGLIPGRLPTEVIECREKPMAEGKVYDEINIELIAPSGDIITMPRQFVFDTYETAMRHALDLFAGLNSAISEAYSEFLRSAVTNIPKDRSN